MATSKSCVELKRSPRLLLWLVVVWPCGETVLVPQVLGQTVEKSSNVTQTVSDLPTWTHHRQASRLLEASHFPLSHITVHVKVKSQHEIKESLPVLLINRNKMFGLSRKFVWLMIPWQLSGGKYTSVWVSFCLSNRQTHKRILGANHQFDNVPPRPLGPLGNLIRQVIKRCSISEGEEEKNSIHLLLAGLKTRDFFFSLGEQGLCDNMDLSLLNVSLYWQATGGQISARHSLHSPTAAGGRKAPSHFSSASQANTPELFQYL